MSSRIYYDKRGLASPLPTTIDQAKRARSSLYKSEAACPTCGDHPRYVSNDKCMTCARIEAADFHAHAVGALRFTVVPAWFTGDAEDETEAYFVADELDPLIQNGQKPSRSKFISQEYRERLVAESKRWFGDDPARANPAVAHNAGFTFWARPEPCRKSGHFGARTIENACAYCEEGANRISPRQQAISDGQAWYTPATPCPRCNTLSKRYVAGGRCQGCAKETGAHQTTIDARQTPDSLFMQQAPDQVITRAQAKLWGMKVYRTGRPCNAGHAGYRYLSTGSCIQCLRGHASSH